MNRLWIGAALAAGLAVGCAHEQAREPEQMEVSSAQRASEDALARATRAQHEAREAQDASAKAHDELIEARQRLKDAEANWNTAELIAQKRQAQARELTVEASKASEQEQEQAFAKQQDLQHRHTQQEQEFLRDHAREVNTRQLKGTVSEVSQSTLQVQAPNHQVVALDINDQSDLRLDGQAVSPLQLPEGAEIRVSYQIENNRPVVVSADAKSPGQQTSDQAPSSNENTP